MKRAEAIKIAAAEQGPTPETLAKMRDDQLSNLYVRGEIDQRQYTAGEELREIWGELSAMYFRRDSWERVDGRRTSFHPLDGLSKPIQQRYRTRWVPWRQWAEKNVYLGRNYLEWMVHALIANQAPYPKAIIVNLLERYADVMEGAA